MTEARQLQDLLDREEIRTVLANYCRGVDRLDPELLESVYHPGAWEDHGAYKGDAETWRQQAITLIPEQLERMRHLIGSINIELHDNVAFVESYFTAGCLQRKPESGPQILRVIDGRYIDRFERLEGRWAITRRIVVKDYTNVGPLNDLPEAYPMSQWGRDDPVYHND